MLSPEPSKPSRPASQSGERMPFRLSSLLVLVSLGMASAQLQFDELARFPVDDDATYALALGDVDGDGDLDVIFVSHGNVNRLYLNDGQGRYTDVSASRLPPSVATATAVALEDIDGDQDLDIVLGNLASQNRLLLNDGQGFFSDGTAGRLPPDTADESALKFADIDGDGDLDLIAAGGFLSLGQTSIYRNDGGVFTDVTSGQMPAMSLWSTDLAVADVDADGDLDLVITSALPPPSGGGGIGCPSQIGSQNRLYLNDGSGTFTDVTLTHLPLDADYSTSVAFADVDGDFDVDMVIGNIAVVLGCSSPVPFSAQTRLYLNDGAGVFSDGTAGRIPADGATTQAVAFADVDQDGDPDLLVGNSNAPSRLYANDGTGSFSDVSAQQLAVGVGNANAVAFGDVDLDGDLDLVFANGNPPTTTTQRIPNRLQLNDGNGTFGESERVPLNRTMTYAAVAGDVDGDGDLDVIFGDHGQDRLLLNYGAGEFFDVTASQLPANGDPTSALALADVDGDGDLDLINGTCSLCSFTIPFPTILTHLFLNNGSGIFVDATSGRLPPQVELPQSIAAGDVDGDGDVDLFFGNYSQNRLYLNDGTGTFSDVTAAQLPVDTSNTTSVSLGDVDQDGDLDLLLGNSGQAALYLNDGTGNFTDHTATHLPALGLSTQGTALGDVDGDGDLDLILGNNGQNVLYLNTGAGVFVDATLSGMPLDADNTASVALGDLDGDGDLDVVCGNASAAQRARVYLNDGTGTFFDVTSARMPIDTRATSAVVLLDVDRDDDLDVFLGNQGQDVLYLNLLRQLETPLPLRPGRPFDLDLYSRYSGPSLVDFALPYFSLVPATIPLAPYGTLGLDPNQMVALPALVIPSATGVATLSLDVPNATGLVGLSVYVQALIVPYPLPAHLTGTTREVVFP